MPDGVLAWIANWATTLSTRPDTMEIARTGKRQLEHRLACFFLKGERECVFVCMCQCWMKYLHHWWIPCWLMRDCVKSGAQGEMQRPCWETLQSYLLSCLPLRLRPSLSTSLFPLSECTPIFLHHHFSTLFAHPSSHPALHTHSQSRLYLSPSSSANGEFVWCLYFYWVLWPCAFPINVANNVWKC